MKNKKTALGIAMIIMTVIPACAQQNNPESDFTVRNVEDGKGIEITEYVGKRTEVRIPPRIQNLPVTSIGESAFSLKNITRVTIPNSVTNIGREAFSYCTSLTNIIIPNSVTSIGGDAFYHCYSLTSVSIPDSVTRIEDFTFFNCTNITSVTIPNSITFIGDSAFYGCANLTNVTFVGMIPSDNFRYTDSFPGDLRTKYLAEGIGTYMKSGSTWTKK
jgi:hypothetical protein